MDVFECLVASLEDISRGTFSSYAVLPETGAVLLATARFCSLADVTSALVKENSSLENCGHQSLI